MDPISVISGITGILLAAAKISKVLHDICNSYLDAPSTIKALIHECYAVNGALSQLQGWLCNEDPIVRSKQRLIQLDLLVNTISAAMFSFTKLQAEVDKLGATRSNSRLMSFKLMWKENDMLAILQQLQSHKTSLTLMLTILSSESDSQIRKTLNEITAFMDIMSKDQQRMWYTMKRSNLFSADGRSLLSKSREASRQSCHSDLNENPTEAILTGLSTVENDLNSSLDPIYDPKARLSMRSLNISPGFSFDNDLKCSIPYQRQYRGSLGDAKSFLTVEDVSDILNLPLPRSQDALDMNMTAIHDIISIMDEISLDPTLGPNQPPKLGTDDTTYYRPASATGCASKKYRSIFSWITTTNEAVGDWDQFWEIKDADLHVVAPDEINRQRSMHRTIQNEIEYHRDLDTFITVYGHHLRFLESSGLMNSSDPDTAALKTTFKNIFVSFEKLKTLHEELIVPLITRTLTEGPWVRDLSDIYNEWLPKARIPYLAFVTIYCEASDKILDAIQHSLVVKQYLELCFKDPRTRGLGWHTLLKRPITRVQLMRLLPYTYSPGATDLGMYRNVSNLPFMEWGDSMKRRLDDETRYQDFKDFRSRLDIPREFSAWIPKDLDEKSSVQHKGDLFYHTKLDLDDIDPGANPKGFDACVVVIDDYMLITRKIRVGPKTSAKNAQGGGFEPNQTRYVLAEMPICLRWGYSVTAVGGGAVGPETPPKGWLPNSPRTVYMFRLGVYKTADHNMGIDWYGFGTLASHKRDGWVSILRDTINTSIATK